MVESKHFFRHKLVVLAQRSTLNAQRSTLILYPSIILIPVTCPACFESFDVPAPHPSEVPCTVDYDCEVCCRPMSIAFWEEDDEIMAEASGLAD